MEPLEIAKQTLHLSKVTFDNTYDAMLLLQEQSQRLIDIYLEQMVAFRDEGKKIADTLMESCKTNGKEFKKTLDNDCEICASFLYGAEKKSEN